MSRHRVLQTKVGHHEAGWRAPGDGGAHAVGVSANPNSVSLIAKTGPRQPNETADQYNNRLFRDGMERYAPAAHLEAAVVRYRDDLGLPQPQVTDYRTIAAPLHRAEAVGAAFGAAKSNPNDPLVQRAYADLVRQTNDQWHLLTDSKELGGLGVKVDFVSPQQIRDGFATGIKDAEGLNPYPTAAAQRDDIVNNGHLSIASIHDYPDAYHPILGNERGGTYDMFRAVHDAFGHAAIGADFTRHGEFEAWIHHCSMFTGDGRRAASTELTGENSYLVTTQQPADHKAALLPDELIGLPFDPTGNLDPNYIADTLRTLAGATKAAAILQGTQPVGGEQEIVDKFGVTNSRNALFGAIARGLAPRRKVRLPLGSKRHRELQLKVGHHEAGWRAPNDAGLPPGSSVAIAPAGVTPEHIKVRTIDEAIALLGNGHGIMFERPQQAVTLIHRLAAIVRDAKTKGTTAKTYDLCKVSVANTNLFCAETMGIPRSGMPQLTGVPAPGSPGDALPRAFENQVDIGPLWRESLVARGIDVTDTKVSASFLRASQNQLNGGKVAGIMEAYQNGTLQPVRLYTSQEDYVVDGHHRWAAEVAIALQNNEPVLTDVARVNLPILELLKDANNFAASMGIGQAGVAAKSGRHRVLETKVGHHDAGWRSGNGAKPAAVPKSAAAPHFDTIPEVNAGPTVVAKWAKKSPANGRYATLMKRWTASPNASGTIGKSAVKGDTPLGKRLAAFMDQAPVIKGPLYRGTVWPGKVPKVGAKFQLPPSSFSSRKSEANMFAASARRRGMEGKQTIIQLAPGSRGLPVGGLSLFPEHETISGGKLVVESVKETPLRLLITARQV